MERLTVKGPSGLISLKDKSENGANQAIKCLSEYEDTGLTPPEIMELKERDTAMEINEIHVDEYYCPVCGAENNCDQGVVEDNFCPRCGQRLKVRED